MIVCLEARPWSFCLTRCDPTRLWLSRRWGEALDPLGPSLAE